MPTAIPSRPESRGNAQPTWIQLAETSVDTFGTLTGLGQQATTRLFELSLAGTEEALRLCADAPGSTIEGFRALLGPWAFVSAPLGPWRWVLGWSAGVFSGYAESVRKTAAPRAGRIEEEAAIVVESAQEIDLREPGIRDDVAVDLAETPGQRAAVSTGRRGDEG